MRIVRLSVSGFRGFPGSQSFDLDADAIVIVGVNGQGKTSLFDAVLWGLTGAIPRLGADAQLVSMYSSSGEARVELELRSSAGMTLTVTRRFDGEKQQLRLVQDGAISNEDAARVNLIAALWPEAAHTPDGQAALIAALTRSVYLQQDLVREFIEADDEQQRFSAVSELVGAGRVTDLSLALERAKTAWTRASNVKAKDLELARSRLASAEGRLAALAPLTADDVDVHAAWDAWWARTVEMSGETTAAPPFDLAEAGRTLDSAVKAVDTRRRSLERRVEQLTDIEKELAAAAEQPTSGPQVAELEELAASAQAQLTAAREALEEAQARAAEQRRLQVELRETQAELRALAELSLRHLDGPCPVCGQQHDQANTRQRLEQIVSHTPAVGDATALNAPQITELAAKVESLERAQSDAAAAVRSAQTRDREWERAHAERIRRMEELGLGVVADDGHAVIQGAVRDASESITAHAMHRSEGEKLALQIARATEHARGGELQQQVESLGGEVAALEQLVNSREQTGELAGTVLEGLRDAASDVVAAQLDQIDPLLQRIYATADPHPSFRAVRLLTKVARGRGRLNAAVFDPHADLSSDSPETVLSSSQLNALAVSVFLALNLGVPSLPMRAVMLDDPLQSLDDVNLLGLIDLLRRTKDQRQLLVSTHDVRFGRLLARKLRPVTEGHRTRVIALSAWGPDGPTVQQDETVRDPERLRIAA